MNSSSWKFLRESLKGQSHLRSDLPCQDDSNVSCLRHPSGEEVLVAVCADGAGSAAFSETGARLACSFVSQNVDRYLQSGATVEGLDLRVATTWLAQLREELTVEAVKKDVKPRELACTLLWAVVGERCASYFQIGDGAIVAGENGLYRPVFWPANGEYANTTYFVTDDDAATTAQFSQEPSPPREVALFTDGLQSLALRYATKEAYTPFFANLFSTLNGTSCVEELLVPFRQFLDSPTVNARTDDDKTLILASRTVAAVSPEPAS